VQAFDLEVDRADQPRRSVVIDDQHTSGIAAASVRVIDRTAGVESVVARSLLRQSLHLPPLHSQLRCRPMGWSAQLLRPVC
jgi:hypothetical protein